MKQLIRFSAVVMLLVVTVLLVTKESSNAMLPRYSITAQAKPDCTTGYCFATRTSDNAVFVMPITGGSYYYGGSGLGPGTYYIVLCCEGLKGTDVVTIVDGVVSTYYPNVTIDLDMTCND